MSSATQQIGTKALAFRIYYQQRANKVNRTLSGVHICYWHKFFGKKVNKLIKKKKKKKKKRNLKMYKLMTKNKKSNQ